MNSRKSGGRIEWIDIAKGVLIIFVIVGHMHIDKGLKLWIDNFHMPAFLILSGFTFSMNKHRDSFNVFLRKKTKSLMIPYFCFSMLAIAVNIIVCLVSGDGLKPVAVNVFETFSLIGIRTLWFLPTLYFAQIILRLLGKLNILIRLAALLLLLVLLMIANIFDEIKLNYLENAAFLSAKRTAAAVVFLYIGCLFEFLYRRYISNLRGLWYSAVIAALFEPSLESVGKSNPRLCRESY